MKNIHILLTDKPSRIVKNTNNQIKLTIQTLPKDLELGCYPQYIYITSDEKIKEGGWHFNLALNLVEKTTSFHNGLLCEKIILTTDPQLIANGIQEIDETFLGWFVKNPSCEFVKIEHNYIDWVIDNYKIIIPQEEPKHIPYTGKVWEPPKKETLEEYSNGLYKQSLKDDVDLTFSDGVKLGAKWQAERMYSEEEVIAIVEKSRETGLTAEYLLLTEQFKKK
jgi:hypothetical protein